MTTNNELAQAGSGLGGGGAVLDLTTCSLPAFASSIHAAIRGIGNAPTERFGSRKVFISAIFRSLARGGSDVGSLRSFGARLVEANRAGLLSLARADLVGAMDRNTVAASEVVSSVSTSHFVIDLGARDPWESAS